MGFVGSQAERFVSNIRADIMFFSTPCLSKNGIITDWSEEETYLRMAMLESAKVSAYLFDRTKYDKEAAFKLSDLNKIDYAVTEMEQESFLEFDCTLIKAEM